mgnify:CR=1 FL=1
MKKKNNKKFRRIAYPIAAVSLALMVMCGGNLILLNSMYNA